jgi:hypothetical protein
VWVAGVAVTGRANSVMMCGRVSMRQLHAASFLFLLQDEWGAGALVQMIMMRSSRTLLFIYYLSLFIILFGYYLHNILQGRASRSFPTGK